MSSFSSFPWISQLLLNRFGDRPPPLLSTTVSSIIVIITIDLSFFLLCVLRKGEGEVDVYVLFPSRGHISFLLFAVTIIISRPAVVKSPSHAIGSALTAVSLLLLPNQSTNCLELAARRRVGSEVFCGEWRQLGSAIARGYRIAMAP